MKRTVLITNATEADIPEISSCLPSNYCILGVITNYGDGEEPLEEDLLIEGKDVSGWTLDGYVIPRLNSGCWATQEIVS